MELTTFIHGSAHDLHQLADQSVQMIATSPPYYGLRAYAGEQGVEWPEVTFRLNEWVEPTTVSPMRCGLGMEPTPVAFIGHLILCLREWRRVLRDDGVCFVNLGDSYNTSPAGNKTPSGFSQGAPKRVGKLDEYNSRGLNNTLKPKDLLGIPWLFAIAARADGWYLRSDCIWAKPNPMPESVTDRPTKAHEYVFLLAKSQKYFYDAEGVKEKATFESMARMERGVSDHHKNVNGAPGQTPHTLSQPRINTGIKFGGSKQAGHNGNPTYSGNEYVSTGTRNLRTVWTIPTQPTPFAHFATFPEKLVQTMIRAGSSERGACPHCGKAWVRRVERGERVPADERAQYDWHTNAPEDGFIKDGSYQGKPGWRFENTDLGFFPACTCPAHEPVPCVVLDPFNGSGTTGKVAVQLGRAYVGVDIATEYLDGVTSERFGAGVQIGMGM